MLLKFNEPASLTGARLDSCLPLRLMYGSQQTLELDCVYGSENTPIDMQGKQCTRWVVSLLKNISSPSDPLVSETFEDNIAVNNRLYMTLPLTTMALYKYVAGGASICVLDVRGFEDGETVASVAFQVPVMINGAMANQMPSMHDTTEVNDGLLTFTKNGEVIATFSANTPASMVVELAESQYDALKGIKAIVVNGEYIPITPTGVTTLHIPTMQDDDTITDITGYLRAEGLIDRNQSNESSLKVWTGTYQEWLDQDKNLTNDICIITDDIGETAQAALDAEAAARRAEQAIEQASSVLGQLDNIAEGIVLQSEKNQPNGIPTLDENGKVPTGQLPSIHAEDDDTITLNESEKMQAVGLKETNAGNTKKVWIGTLQQYTDQNKASSSDLCFVVDDEQVPVEPTTIIATIPPTVATIGTIGQFYVDVETGTLYVCRGTVEHIQDGTITYLWSVCGASQQSDMPDLSDYIPQSEKGAANGVATLGSNSLVPSANLPKMNYGVLGIARLSVSYGIGVANNNELYILAASNATIDGKTHNYSPIVPSRLDYAVRSVLPNVTTIPAATTAYSLLDASATTNNHSWQYFHAPASASTYVFPAVTNTAVAHRIKLTIDFTDTQTYSFEDSQGAALTPLFTPTIAAGDVYEFDCEYSAVKAQWLIWPHKQGAVADDFVMRGEVGAANGVAGLDSSSLVPVANLPKAARSTGTAQYGTVALWNDDYGLEIQSINGRLKLVPAAYYQIDGRSAAYYKPIVPSNLNYAVTAALTDANKIQLTDEQKASAQDTLGVGAAPLILTAAPTTSTGGVVGQLAVDTVTSKTYHCTAVNVDDTDPENVVTTYTWTEDVNAMGGEFNGSVTLKNGSLTISNNTIHVALGQGSQATGSLYNAAFGINTKAYTGAAAFGYNLTVASDTSYAAVFGASGANLGFRNGNALTDLNGALYISQYCQQGVTTIPAATSAYTLTEGVLQHTPDTSPTYTLPAVTDATRTHEITLSVLFAAYARSSNNDSGSAYAWKNGTTVLYTATTSPTAGTTKVYSDSALATEVSTVGLYDSATSSISTVGTYSFESSSGTGVAPRTLVGDLYPGCVVEFLCEWEALTSQWVIMPMVIVEA